MVVLDGIGADIFDLLGSLALVPCETLVSCRSCLDAPDTELGSIVAFWHDIDILVIEQRVEYRTTVSQNPTRSECQHVYC